MLFRSDVREDGQTLYLAECEAIAGPCLYFLPAACTDPSQLGPAAELIDRIQVVSTAARKETVQAQK